MKDTITTTEPGVEGGPVMCCDLKNYYVLCSRCKRDLSAEAPWLRSMEERERRRHVAHGAYTITPPSLGEIMSRKPGANTQVGIQ